MVKKNIKILFIATIIFTYTSNVWCIEESFVFFAFQKGKQDSTDTPPGAVKKDTYLSSLEEKNGSLKENRDVTPTVFSFDFYKINGDFASGFGIELHNYKKSFSFEKNRSSVSLSAVGLLYGLNFYYRGDFWFPFLGWRRGS